MADRGGASNQRIQFISSTTSHDLVKSLGINCLAKIIEPGYLEKFLKGEFPSDCGMSVVEHIIGLICDEQYDEVGAILSLENINSEFYYILAQKLLELTSPGVSQLFICTLNTAIKKIKNIPSEFSDEVIKKYGQIIIPLSPSSNNKATETEEISYKQITRDIDNKTDDAIEEALLGLKTLNEMKDDLLTHKYINGLLDCIKNNNLIFYRGTFAWIIYTSIKRSNQKMIDILIDEVRKRNLIEFLFEDTLQFISDSYDKMKEMGITECKQTTLLCGRVYFNSELRSRLNLIFFCIDHSSVILDSDLGDKFMSFCMKILENEWGFQKNIFFEYFNKVLKDNTNITFFVDGNKILEHEEAQIFKTLQPSHFSATNEGIDFFLWLFNRDKICNKVKFNLFWDVASSAKGKSIKSKVIHEIETKYKHINDATKEVHTIIKDYSELFPKENDKRKILIINKVKSLLLFYMYFIKEMKKHTPIAFKSPKDGNEVNVNISIGAITKEFTFPSFLSINSFIKDVNTSFFGRNKTMLCELFDTNKIWLHTMNIRGEVSRFIPNNELDLHDITDISIEIPKEMEDVCTKEISTRKNSTENTKNIHSREKQSCK